MAGIGFELEKIYKEDGSIGRLAAGMGYSTIITIGPTIIVIAAILLLYWLLGYTDVKYADRELLASVILYVFIFATIFTAPGNAVFSRYIADKIFMEQYEDILPSYYSGILLNVVTGVACAFPIGYRLITIGRVPLLFVLVSFVLWISNLILFFSMTYLYATKDYKIVTAVFLVGMILGILSSLLFHYVFARAVIDSILYGLAIGSFLIAVFEFGYIRNYFPDTKDNYLESYQYLWKYKLIFAANFFYFLGLYVHNFVFWTTDMKIVVADTLVSMQPYDMASCLALFSNISSITIFTVMAETRFHDKFQKYMESVIGGTYRQIAMNKTSMFRLLIQQISHVFAIQLIITAVLFMVVIFLLPSLGFGGIMLKIYPALAVAYLVIFLMYANIVYLFYFNDNKGALWTSFVYFLMTFAGACFSKNFSVEFYGVGALAGAICGWTVSFFRLRFIEAHFDEHIFCSQKVVNQIKEKNTGRNIVYEKGSRKEKTSDLW